MSDPYWKNWCSLLVKGRFFVSKRGMADNLSLSCAAIGYNNFLEENTAVHFCSHNILFDNISSVVIISSSTISSSFHSIDLQVNHLQLG